MPSKKPTKKKESSGEEVAGMILDELKNIQIKLSNLNDRLSKVEKANINPLEYSGRLSKVEGRLGI